VAIGVPVAPSKDWNGVLVAIGVGVDVAVDVGVTVGVDVDVDVGVTVGVDVDVDVGVGVDVAVDVGVGVGEAVGPSSDSATTVYVTTIVALRSLLSRAVPAVAPQTTPGLTVTGRSAPVKL
jgi:hypothetical protein